METILEHQGQGLSKLLRSPDHSFPGLTNANITSLLRCLDPPRRLPQEPPGPPKNPPRALGSLRCLRLGPPARPDPSADPSGHPPWVGWETPALLALGGVLTRTPNLVALELWGLLQHQEDQLAARWSNARLAPPSLTPLPGGGCRISSLPRCVVQLSLWLGACV